MAEVENKSNTIEQRCNGDFSQIQHDLEVRHGGAVFSTCCSQYEGQGFKSAGQLESFFVEFESEFPGFHPQTKLCYQVNFRHFSLL